MNVSYASLSVLRPEETSGKLGAFVGYPLGIIVHRDKDTELLKGDITFVFYNIYIGVSKI